MAPARLHGQRFRSLRHQTDLAIGGVYRRIQGRVALGGPRGADTLWSGPLALGIGPGAELQKPLALAVIGGLSVSTVVTLVFVPATMSLLGDGR
ncbi:MAG: hypothetical protein DMF89_06815 [Acidobacteria bacterium]|nr:MAG: hypothetical protein DMF90_21150 [Acidobacteriota bacterium]PYR51156.1 MAG: hypothetical protein DMF89_06815 [Acidobacteriota bacterium]